MKAVILTIISYCFYGHNYNNFSPAENTRDINY